MANARLVLTQQRSDFLGSYTAYIYADGHVETEPAGRPVQQEDYIRRRRAELLQQVPPKEMQARLRAKIDTPKGFREAGIALAKLAEVTASPRDHLDVAVLTADTGGPLVTNRADAPSEMPALYDSVPPAGRLR